MEKVSFVINCQIASFFPWPFCLILNFYFCKNYLSRFSYNNLFWFFHNDSSLWSPALSFFTESPASPTLLTTPTTFCIAMLLGLSLLLLILTHLINKIVSHIKEIFSYSFEFWTLTPFWYSAISFLRVSSSTEHSFKLSKAFLWIVPFSSLSLILFTTITFSIHILISTASVLSRFCVYLLFLIFFLLVLCLILVIAKLINKVISHIKETFSLFLELSTSAPLRNSMIPFFWISASTKHLFKLFETLLRIIPVNLLLCFFIIYSCKNCSGFILWF